MDDLIVWFRGVLDEDERIARASINTRIGDKGVWEADHARVEGDGITIYDEGGHDYVQAQHIARHDPAAVLADIAAKRAVLDEHAPRDPHPGARCAACNDFDAVVPCRTVRLLASAYAARPGYQESWRP